MKLMISFDVPNLDKALATAQQVAEFCDILEVGTILIHKHGLLAIKEFKKKFPNKEILADTKILDRGKMMATTIAQSDADWITVMAGTSNNVIHAVCSAAKNSRMKVMLDLLDTQSLGQSALEAKDLGVDALIFHRPHDEKDELLFLEDWDMLSGNTNLPIFISAKIKRANVEHIVALKPAGIVVGTSIVTAENPVVEAEFFSQMVKPKKGE